VQRRNVMMSFGFGMIFPNTTAAALSCVAPERIGYASSLFNMLRNTGAGDWHRVYDQFTSQSAASSSVAPG
jgi:hypothetical protein